MPRTTERELSGVFQAWEWQVSAWVECAAHPADGRCCVLAPRIWALTPERLEPTCLPLSSLLPPGVYVCAKCGYELFSSCSKYAHSSPWPAFTETIHADSVAKRPEHNSPKALKVGGSPRGWGGVLARESPRWLLLLCFPHSSRGLESVCAGLLASATLPGEPGVLMETGKQDCFPVRAPGWRSTSPAHSYFGKWVGGGHHLCWWQGGHRCSCFVVFPGVLWQVWQWAGT